MKTRWKRKMHRHELTKRKKSMRKLQRANRRKRNKSSLSTQIYYSNEAFHLLREKQFASSKFANQSFGRDEKKITIPPCFSISENPNETIWILKKLFSYGSDLKIHKIELDHSKCMELEIAASTIMDIIVLAIKEHHRKNKSDITFQGTIPTEGRVKDVFMASGLAAHMELHMHSKLSVDTEKLELFKLKSGKHNSGISGTTATVMAEYIIKCMNTQGYTLNQKGINNLSNLFGEVLNNCEIHGGRNSIWYALGHYQLKELDNAYGEIQLVIFNFGNTIYQQLCGDMASNETKEKLLYLERCHKGLFSKCWDKEAMYTLFSIQEGISRLRDSESTGNSKRGTGTIRLIDNFKQIGKTNASRKPLMTITSGSSQIRFDEKYSLNYGDFNDKILGNGKRKIIAFNNANDIFSPPDQNNVKKLETFFPGTIISMDFFFDREYLERIAEK